MVSCILLHWAFNSSTCELKCLWWGACYRLYDFCFIWIWGCLFSQKKFTCVRKAKFADVQDLSKFMWEITCMSWASIMDSSKAFMVIGGSFLYVRKCKNLELTPWDTVYYCSQLQKVWFALRLLQFYLLLSFCKRRLEPFWGSSWVPWKCNLAHKMLA